MNCAEIIKMYLLENGFDGLAAKDCGCPVDDLVCCGALFEVCVPARKKIVSTQEEADRYDVKIGDTIYEPAEDVDK